MLKAQIKHLIQQYFEDTRSIRQHLHRYPELSFQEYETSKFVQKQLTQLGIDFQNGVADTGIVALIKGKNPNKKVVALRADMDALPIQEKNDVPYKSQHSGIMHACGHDVHTASLLGACRVLNELKDQFEGTIKCIFQPGEECLPGGASLMIKAGALQNPIPQSILGQHVHPELPAGTVGFCPGMFMASADEISLVVRGKGGHGAMPHLAIDPVTITAQIITGLQQLVSRFCDPTVPSVLTFGKIETDGGWFNIIPEAVHLRGTFRTFNEDWRYKAHQKIKEIAASIAQGFGGSCEIDIHVGYPALYNNEALTLRSFQAAKEYLDASQVHELPMRMTAEDFSYYTHVVDGCFYRLGVSNEARGISSPVHTPTFDIDEEALKIGAGLMAWLALEELKN